ncbi:putative retrotransposon hot spot protein (RHS) [Trypanosoma cruzi]|uniref:Putative retrotransposon hot spot protein (RHS) n=1 Tax=Trypanosoma cruzi TaxID=5693 RepID=A0A2V2VVF3_TRYCR|nr:putative retrotransposon hot spot protein (RHS) [Trypanosoma cruzi]RNC47556.1 retrotransposon hot spot (RHS) protein [Trypanosoma cruzi]
MPGKRKRVHGDDNTESQASAVPQGDLQTRARLSSHGDTDQPAATHIRVEETRQPQWTLDSWLDKVLLEEKERTMEMRLNDFLQNYFDGRGVEEFNWRVYVQDFLSSPNEFIKDEVLLDTIKASPPYQELKKEREEYYVLLGASNKLSDERLLTLRHWRDFKKKDTVIPLARAQINKAYSHILRVERWKAEEKARRERQELLFTIHSRIDDAVFKGRVRVDKMKLNDFLTMELDGRGALDANRDVLLEGFLRTPRSTLKMREYWAKYRHRIVTRGWRGL